MEQKTSEKNKMAVMPMKQLLFTMSVPLMLSLIAQSLYNIVDGIFVAKFRETALTATSLAYSVQFLMIAACHSFSWYGNLYGLSQGTSGPLFCK